MKINGKQFWALEEIGNEPEFNHFGCDNCNNGLGDIVISYRARTKDQLFYPENNYDYYELCLCQDCLCAYFNGDELPEDCNNIYQI